MFALTASEAAPTTKGDRGEKENDEHERQKERDRREKKKYTILNTVCGMHRVPDLSGNEK